MIPSHTLSGVHIASSIGLSPHLLDSFPLWLGIDKSKIINPTNILNANVWMYGLWMFFNLSCENDWTDQAEICVQYGSRPGITTFYSMNLFPWKKNNHSIETTLLILPRLINNTKHYFKLFPIFSIRTVLNPIIKYFTGLDLILTSVSLWFIVYLDQT